MVKNEFYDFRTIGSILVLFSAIMYVSVFKNKQASNNKYCRTCLCHYLIITIYISPLSLMLFFQTYNHGNNKIHEFFFSKLKGCVCCILLGY